MASLNSCPEVSVLESLLDGSLSEAEQGGLAAHLECCSNCQDTLEELAATQGTWSAARHLNQTLDAPGTALARVLAEAKRGIGLQDEIAGPKVEPAPIDLSFLEPAEAPGYLGRLGHYDVIEIVGRGGMGIVLKAFDRVLQRVVAIKMLAPHLAVSPVARKRFIREARAAAAICHDHVVTIHAVEEINGQPYIVMQYVPGVSLQKRLDDSGALELKEILRIGAQIAAGLAAAHAHGLIHRDIKPANILLENGVERVKITDFGLARAADDMSITHSGDIAGTAAYMAPEQALGKSLDARADLFSLGSVLYALCTGRPPFRAKSQLAVLRQVCDKSPRPIRERNPDVPEWLTAVVEKLQAKNPEDRFQTASEVADLLSGGLAHVQHPESAAPFVQPPAKPWRARLVVCSVAVVLLCAVAAAGIAFAPALYRIATNQGELVIETDDEEVEVHLKEKGQKVAIKDLNSKKEIVLRLSGDKEQSATLPAGEYEITLAEAPAELRLSRERFTLTRGGQKIVEIWREASGTIESVAPLRRFRGHIAQVDSVNFSFDGRYVVSGSRDKTIRVWETETGRMMYVISPGAGEIHAVACSPTDSRFVAVGADGIVRCWDLISGEEIWRAKAHEGGAHALAYSPDGRFVLSGGVDAVLRLWDAANGQQIRQFHGHTSGISSAAISPDGRQALSGSPDRTVRLWDLESGGELHCLEGHTSFIWSVAFLPDDRHAVSGGPDKSLRLWDLASGRELFRFPQHPTGIFPVAATPDGRSVLSGSGLRQEGDIARPAGFDNTIRMWDVASGREVRRFEGHESGLVDLAVSPDGRFLASGASDQSVILWDLTGSAPMRSALPVAVTGRELRRFVGHEGRVYSVAVSADSRHAVSGGADGTLRLWDLQTGDCVRTFTGHEGWVFSVALSPDGRTILSGGRDRAMRLWDAQTGQEIRRMEGCKGVVHAVAFSPDGSLAASGSSCPVDGGGRMLRINGERTADYTLRIWDVHTGQVVREWAKNTKYIRCVAFSPNGRQLLSGGEDSLMRLWDVQSGEEIHAFQGHGDVVVSVAFSPDGGRAVSTGFKDQTVRVWDLENRRELCCFAQHTGQTETAVFSPDGRHVLSSGFDKTLRLWDAGTGHELHRLQGHTAGVLSAVFTHDGRHIVSASRDATVRLWKLPEGEPAPAAGK